MPSSHREAGPPFSPDREMVLASLRDAVIVLSADGKICHVNPAAEVLFDRSHSGFLGADPDEVFADAQWLCKLLERKRASMESTVRGKGRLGSDDGPEIVAVATTLHDRGGAESGIVLTLQDSGQHRWLGVDETAREHLEELDRLVASIGHELNNPLSGIRGAAQILTKKLADRPQLAEYGAMIVRQVDRMAELIDNLMKLEAPSPPMSAVNIHRVLQEVTMLEQAEADRRGVQITTGFDPSLPPVLGNAAQLQQLFLNLLKNALAVCPDSEGTIRIATRMEHSFYVDTSTGRVRYLSVEISDNGPGFDEETLRHMFSPFYSGTEGGHGIGLTIARNIVAIHGGHIRASAGDSGGASFRVTLPVAEE